MKRATKTLHLLGLLFLLVCAGVLLAQPHLDGARPGSRLVVGVLHDPPYLIKAEDGTWTGLNVEIWKAISRELNVDYEFREMAFEQMMDALKEGTMDISIEAFFLLAERQKFMDYSVPYGTFTFAFGLPKNSPLRGDVNYALLNFMESPGWPSLLKKYGLEQNPDQNRGNGRDRSAGRL